MTGNRIQGTPAKIASRQPELNAIYTEHLDNGRVKTAPQSTLRHATTSNNLTDDEVIEKASAAKNGSRFATLWAGRWRDAGYQSHSEADAALLGELRFWTGGNPAQAMALFSQSGLMREKWNRPDYQERTWKAINHGEVYVPSRKITIGSLVPGDSEPAEKPERKMEFIPFPVTALPEPFQGLVGQGSEAIGCDPVLIALPLLTAAAGAIGNARRIMLKRGWCEPAVLWTATVAESGTLKSPAFEQALDGLIQIEDAYFRNYQNDFEQYKRQLQEWKSKGSEGLKPEPPQLRRVILRDTTVERIAEVLEENPRGVVIARDELAVWIGGFDKYRNGRGEDCAQWLEMHRAGRVTVDRKTGERKTIHVQRAAVSITGTIQPSTLTRILEEKYFENGMAARMLLASPPRKLRKWAEIQVCPEAVEAVRKVFTQLSQLSMSLDALGNRAPIDMPMTPEAKARWIIFYNVHGSELNTMADERLAAAWSKMEGAAARLALIIHCVRNAAIGANGKDTDTVGIGDIEAAMELIEWFKHETRRIYQLLSETSDERDTRKVLAVIENHGGSATARDIVRTGICGKNIEKVQAILDQLAENGQGSWTERKSTPKGGRPTRAFQLYSRNRETPKPNVDSNGVMSVSRFREANQRKVSQE